MQCNFSDHIVAFGSASEWLSDISTAAPLCSAKIAPAVSRLLSNVFFVNILSAVW